MNIKQAKERYTLEGLLSRLGFEPDRKRSKPYDLWYASPFRPDETVPSFHVDPRRGFFKDFGQSEKGGDLIDFVKLYLKYKGHSYSISHALQWLEDMDPGYVSRKRTTAPVKSKSKPVSKEEPYKLISAKLIFSPELFAYLDQRQITHKIARQYLRQVYFMRNETEKKMYGLGFQMRSGGYDVRNTYGFKTTIGPKDITFIRGKEHGTKVELFEGVMDFLTKLSIENTIQPEFDTIILNSTNLYEPACDFIKENHYSDVVLWLDNDKAGVLFMNAIVEQFEEFKSRRISLYAMNHIHKGFKDLNEWHTNPNLTLENKKEILKSEPRIFNLNTDDEALLA